MHGRDKKCTQRKAEGKRPLGRIRHRWDDKRILRKKGMRKWTGFVWLSIISSGGLFKPFTLSKRLGIS
jgi:hypothetical protein